MSRQAALGKIQSGRVAPRDVWDEVRCARKLSGTGKRRIFSLYNLTSLNRRQVLAFPPVDWCGFCRTAARSRNSAEARSTRRSSRFGSPTRNTSPIPIAMDGLVDEVGSDTILSGPDRVEFLRPGTALTLNGIAQGYVTDRIVDPLRRGIERCLVDLGETRGAGARPDGRGWQVGIKDRNATDGFHE